MVRVLTVIQEGDACLVKSCNTVILRTGRLVKESHLEIPIAGSAVYRASSEVVSLGKGNQPLCDRITVTVMVIWDRLSGRG